MKKGSVKNRQVLTDEVYESIKSLLMDHVILPGARVSIDGLARELKVSQTPVREALARLEADELVVRKPLTGYSSTPVLTLKELLDLYDFRFMIEPRATELATKKLTVDGEKRLKSELAIGKKITSGSNYVSYRALTEHDARFHNLVLELSTNTFNPPSGNFSVTFFKDIGAPSHVSTLKSSSSLFFLDILNYFLVFDKLYFSTLVLHLNLIQ